jgi:hypothetical protein
VHAQRHSVFAPDRPSRLVSPGTGTSTEPSGKGNSIIDRRQSLRDCSHRLVGVHRATEGGRPLNMHVDVREFTPRKPNSIFYRDCLTRYVMSYSHRHAIRVDGESDGDVMESAHYRAGDPVAVDR